MLKEIWRYPIKSCAGEQISETTAGKAGLEGDRSWAFLDPVTGHIASAKRPSRWAPLLDATASFVEDSVQIRFPDGSSASTADLETLNALASNFLGRDVALRRAADGAGTTIQRTDPIPETLAGSAQIDLGPVKPDTLGRASPTGTFFDYAPIHIVTTPTLHAIEDQGAPGTGDPRRFRPNLVLDIDGPPFQENDWPGKRIHIGDATLQVIAQTPRCVVPTMPVLELEPSPATLRRLAALNRIETDHFGLAACAGAYAVLEAAAQMIRGSAVRVAR